MKETRKALGKGLEQLFSSEQVDFDSFEQEIISSTPKNEIEIIPLKFINDWKNFGGEYSPGRIIKKGNEITLSWVIKGNNFSTVCVLPEDCRPKNRLIFSVNQMCLLWDLIFSQMEM